MKQLITFTASIVVAASLTACGGGGDDDAAPAGPAAATRAQLDACPVTTTTIDNATTTCVVGTYAGTMQGGTEACSLTINSDFSVTYVDGRRARTIVIPANSARIYENLATAPLVWSTGVNNTAVAIAYEQGVAFILGGDVDATGEFVGGEPPGCIVNLV
jgi:hypothetical protein